MTIHVLVTRSRPRWITVVVAGALATWLLSPIDFEATETPVSSRSPPVRLTRSAEVR